MGQTKFCTGGGPIVTAIIIGPPDQLYAGPIIAKVCAYTDIFLEEPQNATIEVSGNATFLCSVSNSSFELLWLVDGYDADFGIYHERGFTVMVINATAIKLHVEGDKRNNHSVIQCVAILYQDYEILDHAESKMAVLIVLENPIAVEEDRVLPSRTQNYHQSSTVDIDITQTLISHSSSTGGSLISYTTPPAPCCPVHSSLEWNKELVAGKVYLSACVPVLMLV